MNDNKKLEYDGDKDIWYLIPLYNPALNTNSPKLDDEKEVIFIGDNRHNREKLDDLIELIFMENGYSSYYIQIIVHIITKSK